MTITRFSIILFYLTIGSFVALAQDVAPPAPTTTSDSLDKKQQVLKNQQVFEYEYVTEPPQFVVGDYLNQKFISFIQSKVIYPREALQKGIQGKVYVEYVVDSTGAIKDVKILKGVPELNQAVLDAFKGAPKYKRPGYNNGRAVNVRITIPVFFKLN